MNKNIFLFIPMLLLILVSACKEDVDPPVDPMTIVQTAQATADLSFLVEAVVAADLVDALNSGTFTVFAPNNAAFQALLDSDPAWDVISDIPVETLTSVLLYHVVEGEVKEADLSDTYVNTLSQGPNAELLSLQINVTDGVFFDGDAAPLSTDIQTSNGVVHVIDKVMLPNSLVDFATGNDNFSILVSALLRFGTDYLGPLSGTDPLTIFAPSNAAFEALFQATPGLESLDQLPDPSLRAILNYHIYAEDNVQSDQLTDGQEIPMFGAGDKITISFIGEDVAINTIAGQTVGLTIANVQSTNGVIHVVDQVMDPRP